MRAASASVIDQGQIGAAAALEELMEFGFLRAPSEGCHKCGSDVSEAAPYYMYPGKLYYRCTQWRCRCRNNVTDYSIFRGTRMSLYDLLRTVTFYCRCNRSKAPLVSDASAQLKLNRKQVETYTALCAVPKQRPEWPSAGAQS